MVWRRRREAGENKFSFLFKSWRKLYEGKEKGYYPAREIRENKLSSAEKKALILRHIFESMPGKTFEEKAKNYEKFRKESFTAEVTRTREGEEKIKGSYHGLPWFVGIKASKGKYYSMKLYEELAGVRKIDKKLLEKMKKIKRDPEYVSKMKSEEQLFLNMMDSLGIVKVEGQNRKKYGSVRIIDEEAFNKVIETGYIPWPDLTKISLKKKERELDERRGMGEDRNTPFWIKRRRIS